MTMLETGLLLQRIGFKLPDLYFEAIKEDMKEVEEEFLRLYEIEEKYNGINK